MPTDDEFRTTDIHLACYILSTGAGKYRGITWGSERAVFLFCLGPGADVAAEYLNGAEAPAKTPFDSLRSLRTHLNEGRPIPR